MRIFLKTYSCSLEIHNNLCNICHILVHIYFLCNHNLHFQDYNLWFFFPQNYNHMLENVYIRNYFVIRKFFDKFQGFVPLHLEWLLIFSGWPQYPSLHCSHLLPICSTGQIHLPVLSQVIPRLPFLHPQAENDILL